MIKFLKRLYQLYKYGNKISFWQKPKSIESEGNKYIVDRDL